MHLRNALVIDAARGAFARGGKGRLAATRLDDAAATVIEALLARNRALEPGQIDELIVGNVRGCEEFSGLLSNALLRAAGLPVEMATATVNQLCGSSMQALHMAARSIMTGANRAALTVGVERMTATNGPKDGADTPLTRPHARIRSLSEVQKRPDPRHSAYFSIPFPGYLVDAPANDPMPQTAQNVAELWNLSRLELDEFAVESHQKASSAYEAGRYRSQIVKLRARPPALNAASVDAPESGEGQAFDRDECVRSTTVSKLAELAPLPFVKSYGGREVLITAGNSCPINDGVSALLLANDDVAAALGERPMARIVSMAVSGVKPQLMGVGTVPASRKALTQAGLTPRDIGLAEINEAFAAQAIVTIRELGLDPDIVNVNGGSIAIGHPLGASGIRLIASLCHEMRRRGDVRYGLATMCIGSGMGIATVLEANR